MEQQSSTFQDILSSVRELQARLDKLEKENVELKGIIKSNNKNNKFLQNIMERSAPSIEYNDWIEYLLNNVEFYLNTVFESDLISGIESLLKDSFDKFETLPVIAFHRKPNIFYYYSKDGNWILLDNSEFTKLIGRIEYRFLLQFNTDWYQPNIQNIKKSEEYRNKYDSYYLKILGGNRVSNEVRHNRIQQYFYKLIRERA